MTIIDPFSKSQLVLIPISQNLIQFDVFFVGSVWYDLRVKIPDIVCRPQTIPIMKMLELHSRQKQNIPRRQSVANDAISEALEVLFEIVLLLSEYVCGAIVSVPPSDTTKTNLLGHRRGIG